MSPDLQDWQALCGPFCITPLMEQWNTSSLELVGTTCLSASQLYAAGYTVYLENPSLMI